jgi:hypothetical protein
LRIGDLRDSPDRRDPVKSPNPKFSNHEFFKSSNSYFGRQYGDALNVFGRIVVSFFAAPGLAVRYFSADSTI